MVAVDILGGRGWWWFEVERRGSVERADSSLSLTFGLLRLENVLIKKGSLFRVSFNSHLLHPSPSLCLQPWTSRSSPPLPLPLSSLFPSTNLLPLFALRLTRRSILQGGYAHPLTRSWQSQSRSLTKEMLMYPIFITDNPQEESVIESLPGQKRWGVDRLEEVSRLKGRRRKREKRMIWQGLGAFSAEKSVGMGWRLCREARGSREEV